MHFCVKFVCLMSELEILEKSTNIQRTDFYLVSCVSVNFQEKKTYDAPMKPSVLFCFIIRRLKVARYSFSGLIPPKFDHKLRRRKERFGFGVVIAIQWHLYLFYLQQHFLTLETVLSNSFTGRSFFPQKPPRCSWCLSEICKSVIQIFWVKLSRYGNKCGKK